MVDIGEVEEIDRGWDKIRADLKAIASVPPALDIGILGKDATSAHGEDGPTNAEIGTMHEFGGADDRPPERSFLRSTMAEGNQKYFALTQRVVTLVYEGKLALSQGLGLVGARVLGDVRAKIRAGISPGLAESTKLKKTVAGKTGNTPLIDTGQLLNALSWIVRRATDGK